MISCGVDGFGDGFLQLFGIYMIANLFDRLFVDEWWVGHTKYSYVFVGFPVWWYREPSIIDTFMESYDWNGITVIPFCTSGGSGLGDSGKNMRALGKGAKVVEGKRLSGNVSEAELKSWIEGLHILSPFTMLSHI